MRGLSLEVCPTMLETLRKSRVVDFELIDKNAIIISEACDNCFYIQVNKEDLLRLIKELQTFCDNC